MPHNPNAAGLAGVVSELVAWRHTAGCSDYVDRYGWFAHRLFWRWWWLEAKTLEILLCGALTLTFASALEYVGWPKSLSVAIGGGVGLIGVDAIRGAAMRVIGNKFGSSKE